MTTPATLGLSRGLRYMIGSAFMFSLMGLFVKVAGRHLPSQEIVLIRSVVTLFYSYLLLRWQRVSWRGQRTGLLILRGVVGFVSLSCLYFALTRLPLADTLVLQHTSPVFTTLLAALWLKEPIGRREIAGILLSLLGVVLVARPGFLFGTHTAGLDPLGVAAAMGAAIFSAGAYTIVRELRRTEHPLTIVFYFPLVSTIGSLPMALPTAVWPSPLDWLVVVAGVGLSAQIAQVWMTRGLAEEQAGRAVAMNYLQVVFGALWGLLFFREIPTPLSLLGMGLIFAGTWLVARVRA
ncbi:DMT family transporter [Rhodothermus marinus]|uniref:DMT family transporter n=1 Tax=Rhodothermus marinus TaxID=29549 RepID=UPI0012BA38EA|nr:DMT family transporter [Rhodothermus marinus]BBM69494.1 membrane protein [Rhodothermus marinus]BBM72476.1 membrane protein [Rhodothermus marinus]